MLHESVREKKRGRAANKEISTRRWHMRRLRTAFPELRDREVGDDGGYPLCCFMVIICCTQILGKLVVVVGLTICFYFLCLALINQPFLLLLKFKLLMPRWKWSLVLVCVHIMTVGRALVNTTPLKTFLYNFF